jgi:AcrR family transcriptional regulator
MAWISEGLALLADSGVDAVRVERLADRMGTSKVSFYWHFKDRPDFLASLLSTWQYQTRLNMPDRPAPPPRERLRRLLDLPTLGDGSAYGASVELAIRLWVKGDAMARQAVADIDAERLAYIEQFVISSMPDVTDTGARAYLMYGHIMAEAFILGPRPDRAVCETILNAAASATQFVGP